MNPIQSYDTWFDDHKPIPHDNLKGKTLLLSHGPIQDYYSSVHYTSIRAFLLICMWRNSKRPTIMTVKLPADNAATKKYLGIPPFPPGTLYTQQVQNTWSVCRCDSIIELPCAFYFAWLHGSFLTWASKACSVDIGLYVQWMALWEALYHASCRGYVERVFCDSVIP
jgi:hypothetical protein